MTFRLGVIGSAFVVSVACAGAAVQEPAHCPVSIELAAISFPVSSEVRPGLVTQGPKVIYLSGRSPRGFRVEKEVGGRWMPPPVDGERKELDLVAVEYRFEAPSLIPIVWRDIALPRKADTFTVPPGRYRLVLSFSLSDPSASSTVSSAWCTIQSTAFIIEKEQPYSRWESD